MTIHKKPVWTGKYVDPLCIDQAVFPIFPGENGAEFQWPLVQLDGASEMFFVVFSDIEKLQAGLNVMAQIMCADQYRVKQVDDPMVFYESLRSQNIRLMCNPVIVNGRTKYTEIVLSGEQWKLLDPERN